MQSRKRHHIHERLKRLCYIKRELSVKLSHSVGLNRYAPHTQAYAALLTNQQTMASNAYISRQRIWCPVNSSPKITSKHFRLSRFELNHSARKNQLPGLLKRGW